MKKNKVLLFSLLFLAAVVFVGCQKTDLDLKNEAPDEENKARQEENPSVRVQDQAIVNGTVTVPRVYSQISGWMVIHAEDNGKPGIVIGHSKLDAGVNTDVVVNIDVSKATNKLYAMLHVDLGEEGIYEFPGDDVPEKLEEQVLAVAFTVTGGLPGISPTPQSTASPGTSAGTSQEEETTLGIEGNVNTDVSIEQEEEEEEDAPSVKQFTLTAKQWEFSPSVIRVRRGDTVRLSIKSIDVNHGIAIPDFNVSNELKSGETVHLEFVANKTGTFSFFCTVFCGSGHNTMKGTLVVE